MGWPDEPFLNLRQTATPKGTPANGGALLYVKSDGKLYTKNSAGVETPVETTLGDVTLAGTQTLSNKTLAANTKIVGPLLDSNGNTLLDLTATASAVNYLVLANNASLGAPKLTAAGFDANININLVPKGTGAVLANAVPVATTTDTQTLTNKTLSTGTKVGAATTDISGGWTSYTPTVANLTLGNGTMVARYVQMGKTLFFRFDLVGGTTSSASGQLSVPLPAGMTGHASGLQPVHTRHYNGSLLLGGSNLNAGATSILLYSNGVAISALGSGHEVSLSATIELA